jgi:hypothetical protein
MKIVFIVRENSFNLGIIEWLSEYYTLSASFFTEVNRMRLSYRINRIKKRMKKYGLIRVVDELAFHAFYRAFYLRKDIILIKKYFPDNFVKLKRPQGTFFQCENIHDKKNLQQIRSLSPDIIISVCTNTFFKPELFTLPKYGTYVIHEGILPEYKGLHTVAWALMKKEYNYVGCSFFRVNGNIDGGDILCNNIFPEAGKYGFQWGFVSHASILFGLPSLKDCIDKLYLNNGKYEKINTSERKSHLYSWATLSVYLKYKLFHLHN